MDAVLKYAGIVTNSEQTINSDRLKFRHRHGRGSGRADHFKTVRRKCRPDHGPAAIIGALLQRPQAIRLIQERSDFTGNRGAVVERHEHAMIIAQQFNRMGIRGRNHRLAQCHRVGQRPRG